MCVSRDSIAGWMFRMLGVCVAPSIMGGSAQPAAARLVINEVFYNVSPQAGNQYVELYNAGATNDFLDGKILTDEADNGVEGIFQFPGSPGGTNLVVAPGAFVVIAVSATNATATADWECYAGGSDTDNPLVPNLTLVGGLVDLGLYSAGDNVILADGTDIVAPIDPATVIDGMNFAGGNGELAWLSAIAEDTDPTATSSTNASLCRCPDGQDNNIASAGEFISTTPSPGAANNCTLPTLSIGNATVTEGNAGSTTAVFTVTLSATSTLSVTVNFASSNGTAVAGSDYVATNGVLTFSPGITTRTVNVSVTGDLAAESTETFFVRLSNPLNATILVPVGTGTIIDTDSGGVIFTSVFTRIAGPSGAITTEWTSVSGKTYRLQAVANPAVPTWTNVGNIVTAVTSAATLVDTNTVVTQRVYRVLHLD